MIGEYAVFGHAPFIQLRFNLFSQGKQAAFVFVARGDAHGNFAEFIDVFPGRFLKLLQNPHTFF